MHPFRLALLLVAAACVLSAASAQLHPVDPDANRNFTEIITSKGYPCETHYVTTEDGYILTVFRMPYGAAGPSSSPRPAVFLQHGLLDSSFTWILNWPNQSLPYILADAGYDVWMGNNRGNYYSINHTTLSPKSNEFWEFSWDEMALYDFPAMIQYTLGVTNQPRLAAYVGHSEGTIQAFAALSTNASLADLMNGFVGFGPVVTVGHASGPIVELARFDVAYLWKLFGLKQFLPTPELLHNVFVDFCADCEVCCDNVIELICGQHHGAFNESRMPVMAGHEPAGTSVQNVIHWTQMVHSNKFQMMDYGYFQNKKKYGTHKAPVYDLSKISHTLPMAMYSGTHDILADPTDVAALIAQLPVNTTYSRPVDNYAHLDYPWCIEAPSDIYQQMMGFLKQWDAAPHA
eukprot:TRINITY_DN5737_c0_g1_i1.p1 TRINITY_DN5737_c0_g1~~TRINITY_DN5737_c0_g1_i1.p1  ORF type:complete len:428 (+),score=111.39 TRINITY_DN5737_c0_g1_i1:77-1285(+)